MQDGELSPLVESRRTGEQVEVAVSRLADLDSLGLDGAVEVYDDIHRALSAALEGNAAPEGNDSPGRIDPAVSPE